MVRLHFREDGKLSARSPQYLNLLRPQVFEGDKILSAGALYAPGEAGHRSGITVGLHEGKALSQTEKRMYMQRIGKNNFVAIDSGAVRWHTWIPGDDLSTRAIYEEALHESAGPYSPSYFAQYADGTIVLSYNQRLIWMNDGDAVAKLDALTLDSGVQPLIRPDGTVILASKNATLYWIGPKK